MKNLILEIQAEFFRRLEGKNSWGKNEVKGLYQAVQVEILSNKLVEREPARNVVVQAQNAEKIAENYGRVSSIRDLSQCITVRKPGPFTAELSIINQSLKSEFSSAVMYRFNRVLNGENELTLLPFTHAEVAKDIIEGRATIDFTDNSVTYNNSNTVSESGDSEGVF